MRRHGKAWQNWEKYVEIILLTFFSSYNKTLCNNLFDAVSRLHTNRTFGSNALVTYTLCRCLRKILRNKYSKR